MGFPSPAADYAEERISLDKEFIKHPAATDFFRMETDSMINAFIPPGALLVVDRSITPQNMDIVVAVVEGEFMCRFLSRNEYKGRLIPANSKVKDIEITPEMNVQIVGVVIQAIIDPKKNPHVRAGRL